MSVRDVLSGLTDLIYPPICILCRRWLPPEERPEQICARCRPRISLTRPPFCRRCSRPLPAAGTPLCRPCRERPNACDRIRAACPYTGETRRIVHLFKYHGRTVLRRLMARRMMEYAGLYGPAPAEIDLLVPVPLHARRLRRRGYNQAALLAEELGRRWGVPVLSKAMRRSRSTRPQSRLGRKDRWTNIQGAFRIKISRGLSGKSVCLIDDLVTTGATLSEAAGVLKRAGAREVQAFTLAVVTGTGVTTPSGKAPAY